MLCYHKIGVKDKCEIGKLYSIYKSDKAKMQWLKKGVEHTFIDEDMYCSHEDSFGTNFSVLAAPLNIMHLMVESSSFKVKYK